MSASSIKGAPSPEARPAAFAPECEAFLASILPHTGIYIAAVMDRGGMRHYGFNDIASLASFLIGADEPGATAYHACASFRVADGSVRRKREQVHAVRAYWVDLDVGQGDQKYASQQDALAAIVGFVRSLALPMPTLVNSGYGIHAYWPLTRDLSLSEWTPIAEALKRVAAAYGLRADPTRTADASSLLRPAGTKNRKVPESPRAVHVVAAPGSGGLTVECAPEEFARLLAAAAPAATPIKSVNSEFMLPAAPRRPPGPLSGEERRDIEGALAATPADDYQAWVTVGAALHSTGDPGALAMWDQWSRRSSKYREGEPTKKWASFRLDGGITLGSLFQLAKNHGYQGFSRSVEKLTDVGNAIRLVRLYGQILRYVERFGKWLLWDGARWTFDEERCVERLAKLTAKSLYDDAAKETDDDRRKALARHAAMSESAPRIEAMIRMARSEPGIPVQPGSLDRDRWLLNLKNGTLDLRTFRLRAASPADCITKQAGVAFDPSAACPTWERFIHEVMCGSAEVVEYLQRALGYSLTGSTTEQVMFILYGFGANGKSTLLNAVRDVLGDYAMTCPAETLMLKREGGISNDIARLRGARFVAASETEDGHRLAESLVKQLTGGDAVTARFLHQEFFEFTPEFKIFLAANHRPIILNNDFSIWRRIHLVPFERTFADSERDPDLLTKLRGELPGIFNWMLKGLESYQRVGLKLPAAARAATDHYRSEMDVIGQWIEENCDRNPDASTAAKDLFMDYRLWAGLNGRVAMSNTRFGQRLTEAGFPKIKSSVYRYRGLALKALRESAA